MSIMSHKSNYSAFKYNPNAIVDFRDRLQLDRDDNSVPAIIDELMNMYVACLLATYCACSSLILLYYCM